MLEKVIQSSKNGVIYFSTGSMVLSETFDPQKLQAIFDVFKELPYQVLWKAKRDRFPDGLSIPKNIYFQEWMPQLDILCKFIIKPHQILQPRQQLKVCRLIVCILNAIWLKCLEKLFESQYKIKYSHK